MNVGRRRSKSMTEKISGGAFKQMVAFGAACITREKQAINDLNVFPVPDGDTGTNMSLTIQTAAAELKKCEPATVGEAAKITASALLRGARGNSGVILSLLFRGLSKSAKGLEEMDGVQLAAAMSEGVTTAYGAVMKPAEGTVLTVSRLAAARAEEAAQEQNCAEYVLAEAIATGISGGGIYIEDYRDLEAQVEAIAHVDLIEQELLDKSRDEVAVHLYIAPDENFAEIGELMRDRLERAEVPYRMEYTGRRKRHHVCSRRHVYFQSNCDHVCNVGSPL